MMSGASSPPPAAASPRGFTPRQRMLNAYRGVPSDRMPVAPEFWYYYPARLLGVDMITFEREVPFWQALKTAFETWSCEGWGAAFPTLIMDGVDTTKRETRLDEGRFRQTTVLRCHGREFESSIIFDTREPSAMESFPVRDPADLPVYAEMLLSQRNGLDFSAAAKGWEAVGESYLLEMWLGVPFFDWVAEAMGFEQAALWAATVPAVEMAALRDRCLEWTLRLMRRAARKTAYESFVLGCSASCNSLLGPTLWRHLDKPFIAAVAREAHALGRHLHIHFHGRCVETLEDFREVGVDCVDPFERPPGGDIRGVDGLREVRRALGDSVTFNGNVHTVETLIRGTPQDVRREVREIKEAFAGSTRCIIGTGDQVGRETPDENLAAMIDEAQRE
jgi:hypothetical protein